MSSFVSKAVGALTKFGDAIGVTNIKDQKAALDREKEQKEAAKKELEDKQAADKAALEKQKQELLDQETEEARKKRKAAGTGARRGEGAGKTILTRKSKDDASNYIKKKTLLGGAVKLGE